MRGRKSHFRIRGRFGLPRVETATVTIDRDVGTISVRVLRRRRVDTSTLAIVAQRIVMIADLAKARERLAKRKGAGKRAVSGR
jgi:hypothetical protein